MQPNLFVVRRDEARALDWRRIHTLLLAVEILSPSSQRADRFTKRRVYQEQRVPAYWVVDGDEHVIEVWTPDATYPLMERERLVWHPAAAPAPWTLELRELLRAS